MESFCGFWSNGRKVAEKERHERMLSNLINKQDSVFEIFSFSDFTLGVSTRKAPPSLKTVETKSYFIFASGRLDSADFSQIFPGNNQDLDEACSHNFEAILKDIRGDFVVIIFNKITSQLFCVRDQIGARPFYYTEQDSFLCFASEIELFRKVPDIVFTLDNQWIADSLVLIQSEKYRTPYMGIRKLPPGNLLMGDRYIYCKPYWNIDANRNYSELSFEGAVHIFSEKLKLAVEKRINGCRIIGSELSGGLDSSGVTAIAFKNRIPLEQSFFALSHILDRKKGSSNFPFKDELEYSRALTEKLGIMNHILISGKGHGIMDSLKRSLFIQSGPSQQRFHLFSDLLLDTARQNGIEILLSGFGGDEGVSSNASGFFKELRKAGKRTVFRNELLQYYERKGYNQVPARLRSEYKYFLAPFFEQIRKSSIIRRQKGAELIHNSINTQFSERMDIKRRFNEKYELPDEDSVLERQIRRVSHDHISQRLEYSYLSGKSYGVEYAYPLWDVDLLEFYLSLPSVFKFRNGMGRAIFRESIHTIVPEQIRMRDDKSRYSIPSVYSRIYEDCNELENLIKRCKAQNKFHYLNYAYMLRWLESVTSKAVGIGSKQERPGAFLNAIQILLLQDLERSGEFYSGIQV